LLATQAAALIKKVIKNLASFLPLDLGPWTLDLGPWTLGLGPWTLDLGPCLLQARPGCLLVVIITS